MGQLIGLHGMPSTRSISSIRSSGSCPSRSILLMNVTMGILRMRQTSKSLIVCGLDALAAVDEHHRAVGRGERAVGVLAEVVVAGRVEQVHVMVAVRELQHARGDRDPALALHRHPVAGRRSLAPPLLDRAGQVDGSSVEQELLGQRRLARVGVGDDGERSPVGRFFFGHAEPVVLER